MTVQEIGNELVRLCRDGKDMDVVTRFYDENIVSTEAAGPTPEMRGIEAIKGKHEWWQNTQTVRDVKVEGPFVNGNQFTVIFLMAITEKATGKDHDIHEVALYTVENEKIVSEKFFYNM